MSSFSVKINIYFHELVNQSVILLYYNVFGAIYMRIYYNHIFIAIKINVNIIKITLEYTTNLISLILIYLQQFSRYNLNQNYFFFFQDFYSSKLIFSLNI